MARGDFYRFPALVHFTKREGLALFVFALFCSNSAVAQSVTEEDVQALKRAEACLVAFKNDSAILLTGRLLGTLKRQGQMDSPFGIRVQLAEAVAFEHDQRGDEAINKLIHVRALSSRRAIWDVYATASITLALQYEKIKLPKSSLEHLRDARTCIERYRLDSIYPHYALRMASWHRLFGQRDSALYYTKETLRTASRMQFNLEEAVGHMLMNMLLPASAVEERLQHCLASVRLYEKIKDYAGCSNMYNAISNIHFKNKQPEQTLHFNDSTLWAAQLSVKDGNSEFHLALGYRSRAEIFKALGQWDSAQGRRIKIR